MKRRPIALAPSVPQHQNNRHHRMATSPGRRASRITRSLPRPDQRGVGVHAAGTRRGNTRRAWVLAIVLTHESGAAAFHAPRSAGRRIIRLSRRSPGGRGVVIAGLRPGSSPS